jgi:hypothetical protein
MEIVSFVAGIILTLITLSLKRLFWLLRICMCLLGSYIVLKLKWPYLMLWGINEYTDDNFRELFRSGFLCPGIFITLTILGLFYWLLPMALNKWVVKKMEERIKKVYSSLLPAEIRMVVMKIVRPIVYYAYKIVYSLRIEVPKKKMTEDEETITYTEYVEGNLLALATIFNAILISPFLWGLNWAFYLLLLAILVQVLIIVFSPTVIYTKSVMNKLLVELNNKYYIG